MSKATKFPSFRKLPFIHKYILFFLSLLDVIEIDQIRDPRLLQRLSLIYSQMVCPSKCYSESNFSKEHKKKRWVLIDF